MDRLLERDRERQRAAEQEIQDLVIASENATGELMAGNPTRVRITRAERAHDVAMAAVRAALDERASQPVHWDLIREAFAEGFTYGSAEYLTDNFTGGEDSWDQATQAAFGLLKSDPQNMSHAMRAALNAVPSPGSYEQQTRAQRCENNHACRCEFVESGHLGGRMQVSSECCVHGEVECGETSAMPVRAPTTRAAPDPEELRRLAEAIDVLVKIVLYRADVPDDVLGAISDVNDERRVLEGE